MSKRLTAIIQREGDGYVSLCPELDVASQGDTTETAREHLREALVLSFECASVEELQQRMGGEVFVTSWTEIGASLEANDAEPPRIGPMFPDRIGIREVWMIDRDCCDDWVSIKIGLQ